MTSRTVVLLSGGLDSTVLTAHLIDAGHTVRAVSVDYGQRHRRELESAELVARHYSIDHDVIDLSALGRKLSGSALTDSDVPVPLGHYADESMRATVVPNRNAILLMSAVGLASAWDFDAVATAVHAGDHAVYPDCRPEFVTLADQTARAGTAGFGDVGVLAPFVMHDKTWIAARGSELAAPMKLSWSCYQGGTAHCGQCGTCTERREAFTLAGATDPTSYADGVQVGAL